MPQLTGITNANEFYSNHYLDAILTDDLKEVAKRWRETAEATGEKTPPEKLSSLSREYFRLLDQFKKETEESDRLEIQRQGFMKKDIAIIL
jgi:hypothetical protein